MKLEQRVEGAKQAFAKHVIVRCFKCYKQGPKHRWWLIKRPDDSQYATYIMAMGPHLIVQGDIDLCSFAYFAGDTAEGAVAWIGGCEFGRYICEKACIGTTNRDLVWELDADTLAENVAYWLSDLQNEIREIGEATSRQREDEASFEQALDLLQHRGGTDCRDVLEGLIDDQAIESEQYSAAEVPTTRAIYAWAAVRRLHELLTAEENNDG